jgi:N-terminal domain of ribose phosphate pyrophosphokinase
MRNLVILGGSSHPALTKAICYRLGVPECAVQLGKFSNGETSVQIQESVRDKDVFIITTGCGEINEIIMELFIMLSACKTASARSMSLEGTGGLMGRGGYGVACVSVFETAGCALCETGYSPCGRPCHAI